MAPYLQEYLIYLLGLNLTLTGTFLGLATYLKVTLFFKYKKSQNTIKTASKE